MRLYSIKPLFASVHEKLNLFSFKRSQILLSVMFFLMLGKCLYSVFSSLIGWISFLHNFCSNPEHQRAIHLPLSPDPVLSTGRIYSRRGREANLFNECCSGSRECSAITIHVSLLSRMHVGTLFGQRNCSQYSLASLFSPLQVN